MKPPENAYEFVSMYVRHMFADKMFVYVCVISKDPYHDVSN